MEAYCVKCKAKREMKDPKEITMKNGRQPRAYAQPAAPRCSESARPNNAAAHTFLDISINIEWCANCKVQPFVPLCGAMRSFQNLTLN